MCRAGDDFIERLPKVELHVHIEGTLTPSLRAKFAKRNGIGESPPTASEMIEKYDNVFSNIMSKDTPVESAFSEFFDTFLQGMEVLTTEEDFYELAMNYFRRASEMHVRYVEVFTEFQDLIRLGKSMKTFMAGYRRAQLEAEASLNIRSNWILNFAREMSPTKAMEAYEEAICFREMVHGFGLAGHSDGTSPLIFDDVFRKAKADGFHITAHCDPGDPNIHTNIRECVTLLGGTGVDRIDHGEDVVDRQDLIDLVKQRKLGLTVCPWTIYPFIIRGVLGSGETSFKSVMGKVFAHELKISINSDDPGILANKWVKENLVLVTEQLDLSVEELVRLQMNAIETSWASEAVKNEFLEELQQFSLSYVG